MNYKQLSQPVPDRRAFRCVAIEIAAAGECRCNCAACDLGRHCGKFKDGCEHYDKKG